MKRLNIEPDINAALISVTIYLACFVVCRAIILIVLAAISACFILIDRLAGFWLFVRFYRGQSRMITLHGGFIAELIDFIELLTRYQGAALTFTLQSKQK